MGDTYFTVCSFLFFCTVTHFSAVGKGRGMKFCILCSTTSRIGQRSSSPPGDKNVDTRGAFDISSAGTGGKARWAVGIGGGGIT